MTLPRLLIVAGSDCGGGAGIQADIKTATAFGVYAMTAITAVTVQNTQGVSGWHAVPPETVRGQIEACLTDIGADIVKAQRNLLRNKFGWHRVNTKHALSVLRGERGDRRHRITAQRLHGFDIALNARSTAGIGTGNDEDTGGRAHGAYRFTSCASSSAIAVMLA